jgi:hypothetical protein
MAEARDGSVALVFAEPDKFGIRCSQLRSEKIADVRIEPGLAALPDFDAGGRRPPHQNEKPPISGLQRPPDGIIGG